MDSTATFSRSQNLYDFPFWKTNFQASKRSFLPLSLSFSRLSIQWYNLNLSGAIIIRYIWPGHGCGNLDARAHSYAARWCKMNCSARISLLFRISNQLSSLSRRQDAAICTACAGTCRHSVDALLFCKTGIYVSSRLTRECENTCARTRVCVCVGTSFKWDAEEKCRGESRKEEKKDIQTSDKNSWIFLKW